MAKSTIIVKRKVGRPSTIEDAAFVGMRLPALVLKRVDKWAKRKKYSRSEAMRALIERGLKK